jgi:hypothetical protein
MNIDEILANRYENEIKVFEISITLSLSDTGYSFAILFQNRYFKFLRKKFTHFLLFLHWIRVDLLLHLKSFCL